MRTSVRRAIAATTAGATCLTGALALGALTAAPAQAGETITNYGFSARSFGTVARVEGAGLRSDRTAYSFLGCTRKAGITRKNAVAETGSPISPALHVGAVSNANRTYKVKRTKRVGVRSTSRIADLRLGTDAASLRIQGLASTADAWANRSGKLGGRASFAAADIVASTGQPELDGLLNGATDPLKELFEEIRSSTGGVLVIPGLGELSLGGSKVTKRPRVLTSKANALQVVLYGPDTVKGGSDDVAVKVGHSRAVVHRDLPAGVMRGAAYPLDASVLGDLLTVGRVTIEPLPCNGTDGKVRSSKAAGLDLGNAGVVRVGASNARVLGKQRKDGRARAWTESSLARINIGGSEGLTVTGIVGRANVKQSRSGKILAKNMKGSEIGSITVAGQKRRIGPGETRSFDIPDIGVVRVQPFLRHGSKRGLKTTALRLTILDGQDVQTRIDLGVARAYIKRS